MAKTIVRITDTIRGHKYIWYAFLLASFISCGAKNNANSYGGTQNVTNVTQNSNDASELISSVYDKFVFAIDTEGNDDPADYFSANALKKLQDDYEFDCEGEGCYAFYALRTMQQDSKPGAEDVSEILAIQPIGEGWYEVAYLDMGWSGVTQIKIVDGKIDAYQRCATNP